MDSKFAIQTSINTEFAFEAISTDLSIADCILDLIDNSIDAATSDLLSSTIDRPDNKIPESYEGYCVDINIMDDFFSIRDNCHGVSKELLQANMFSLGTQNKQPHSIGQFGMGFCRAFWKIGKAGLLITDNGQEIYRVKFSKENFNSINSDLEAESSLSAGSKSFCLEIRKLEVEAAYNFDLESWRNELKHRISMVYDYILKKKFKIKFNGEILISSAPDFRSDHLGLRQSETIVTDDGVHVSFEVGTHINYKFKHELGANNTNQQKAISECGSYIICNGRTILFADTTERIFGNKWHSEYHGFVGKIHFESKKAELLPWNTAKNNVVEDNRTFQQAHDVHLRLARTYKTENKVIRTSKGQQTPTQSKTKVPKTDRKPRMSEGFVEQGLGYSTVQKNDAIVEKLHELNIGKLKQLYYSIYTVELLHHTPLVSVGVWSFYETLASHLNRPKNIGFGDFFIDEDLGLICQIDTNDRRGVKSAIKQIGESGNLTKHDKEAADFNGNQLANNMKVLEKFTILILQKIQTSRSP